MARAHRRPIRIRRGTGGLVRFGHGTVLFASGKAAPVGARRPQRGADGGGGALGAAPGPPAVDRRRRRQEPVLAAPQEAAGAEVTA
ncbi:hypothetical protein MANAM107_11120 [Actinomyces capricornis]|uniref:Uncharacterized protein n=1 Tax=Actinomyces capricornis TaxID=2755559 RepID=A0ABM7UAA8_9ACTO|nr:hypothetical protein MANAM107_11120 [Actinomyces capricornis]